MSVAPQQIADPAALHVHDFVLVVNTIAAICLPLPATVARCLHRGRACDWLKVCCIQSSTFLEFAPLSKHMLKSHALQVSALEHHQQVTLQVPALLETADGCMCCLNGS